MANPFISPDSLYATAAQLCLRYGGRSKNWLYRRIANDGFPAAVSFGGKDRFFDLAEVAQWEAAQKKKPATFRKAPVRP